MDYEYLLQFVGTPYTPWKGEDGGWRDQINQPPFWYVPFNQYGLYPIDITRVKLEGCNCAGLINLLYRHLGNPIPDIGDVYPGGTRAYGLYHRWKPAVFDEIPLLLLVPYVDEIYQGHLAIYLGNGKILHSSPFDGVEVTQMYPDKWLMCVD